MRIRLLVVFFVILTLTACSGLTTTQRVNLPSSSSDESTLPKDFNVSLADQLPAFPLSSTAESSVTVVRTGSGTSNYNVNGAVMSSNQGLCYHNGEKDFNSEQVIIPANALQIMVNSTTPVSWAAYNVNLASDPFPVAIEVKPLEWKPDGDERVGDVYIGIGNYTNYAWEWHGPYQSPKGESTGLVLNSAQVRDNYISPSGKLEYVIVVTSNENKTGAYIVDQTTTSTDAENAESTKPYYTDLEDVTFQDNSSTSSIDDRQTSEILDKSQMPNLLWRWVKTLRKDSEITKFNIYRKGPNDPKPVLLGSIIPANTLESKQSFTDSDEQVTPLMPGKMYLYYIQAENEAGKTRLSRPRVVFIPPVAYTWKTQFVTNAIHCADLDFNFIDNMPGILWCEEDKANFHSVLKYSQLKIDTKEPAGPTDWATHTVFDNVNGYSGMLCKLSIVNGKPYIAFLDLQGTTTKIIVGSANVPRPSKAEDWNLYTLKSFTFTGLNTGALDLAITSDNRPIIAYQDRSTNSVNVAIAGVANPVKPDDWVFSQVEKYTGTLGGFYIGSSVNLAINDKNPVLAYVALANLKIASIASYDIVSKVISWSSTNVDPSLTNNDFVNCDYIGGKLTLAYHNITDEDIQFAQAMPTHPKLSNDFTLFPIDGQAKNDTGITTRVGNYSNMLEAFERAAVAYYDSDKNNLRFAWAYTQYPTKWYHWRFGRIDSQVGTGDNVVMRLHAVSKHIIAVYNQTEDQLNTKIKYAELVDGY